MNTLRFLASCLGGGLLAAALPAQQQLDPVTVPVEVVGVWNAEYYVNEYNPASFCISGPIYLYSGEIEDPYEGSISGTANMKPGKAYTVYVGESDIVDYQLYFRPPSGYSVFIENVERMRFDASGDKMLKVRVQSDAASPAGVAGEPRPGRIIWSVGLGQLKDGDSAGDIQLRENDLSASTFTPSALYYDHDNPDVRIISSGGVLRQVYANECLADIQADNGYTFWIRFYSRSRVGSQNQDGTWQTTGAPFVSYKIENPVYPTVDRLKITRTWAVDGSRTSWTQIQKSGSTWTVLPWCIETYPYNSLSQTTVAYADSDRSETVSVKTATGTTVAQSRQEYLDFAWGRELYRTTAGYGASNPLQTTLEYHNTSWQGGNYRQVKWRIAPDGNWERYDYYDDFDRCGQIARVYRPFGDTPATPSQASANTGEVTDFDYTADFTGMRTLPSSIITKRNNIVSAKTLIAYDNGTETRNGLPIVVATREDYWADGSADKLITVTRSYRADTGLNTAIYNSAFLAGKPHSVIRPDGTMTAYVYLWGIYNPLTRVFLPTADGTEFMIRTIEGTTSASGNTACPYIQWGTAQERYYIDGGSAPAFYLIPGKSTSDYTVFASSGVPIWTERGFFVNSTWMSAGCDVTAYEQGLGGFPVWKRSYSGSPYVETFSGDYNEGNLLTWSKDASGIEGFRQYDTLDRLYSEIVSAVTGQPNADELHTFTAYDAADRVVKTWRSNDWNYPNPASDDIVTTTNYDWAGRVTSVVEPGVVGDTVTTYETTNTYFYGGSARVTRTVRSDGGDTISETFLDGRPKSVTGSAQAPRHFGYWPEADGRLRTQTRLSATENGDGWSDTYTDWLGRVSEERRPSAAGGYTRDVREYNSLGQLVRRQLEDDSSPSQPLLAPTRHVYDANGRLTRSGVDVDEAYGLVDQSIDRVTVHAETFEYLDGAWWHAATTTMLTDPTSATTGAQTIQRTRLTGLFTTEVDGSQFTGETRGIDANQTTTIAKSFVDRTARKVIASTTVPGSTTPAVSITINGLKASDTSSTGVVTAYEYDGRGRPVITWGRDDVMDEVTYYTGTTLVRYRRNLYMRPEVIGSEWQRYYYDSAGRLAKHEINNVNVLQTSRYAYNSRGQVQYQWGDAQQPVEYVYNNYGWRTQMKLYRSGSNWNADTWPGTYETADTTTWGYHYPTGLVTSKTDPASHTVSFTFNKRNQVATCVWERLVPTGLPNAGQHVTATYDYYDSTGYDGELGLTNYRTGQLKRVRYNDGTTPVVYRFDGVTNTSWRTGQVSKITDATGSRTITTRLNDLQLDTETLDLDFYGQSPSTRKALSYTYDGLGRPDLLRFGTNSDATAFQTVNYDYGTTTGRVSKIGVTRSGTTYDYDYAYHAGSNLVATVTSGLFQRRIQHQSWRPLIDEVETTWDGQRVAKHVYDYDWALRRTGYRSEGGTLPTALGRNETVWHDIDRNAKGEVEYTNACLGGYSTGTQLMAHHRDWNYDAQGNRTAELRMDTWGGYTPNSLNQYSAALGEALNYDLDGNLASDGVWDYSWDAENRLSSMQTQSWMPGAEFKALTFKYDYLGRRVEKRVVSYSKKVPALGLRGEYFPNQNRSGTPVLVRNDPVINFQWGSDSPGGGCAVDNFSVRWTGKVLVPADGTWTFYTSTDDGTFLWVDGQLLINDPNYHGETENPGSIYLTAGEHTIQMEMFEGGGGAVARLSWQGPGVAKQIIPSSRLASEPVNGYGTDGTSETVTRYVWSGHNLVAELDGGASGIPVLRSYAWGLDLSGTVQGAGGVGGLLEIADHGNSQRVRPVYDGNGNVRGLIGCVYGGVKAAYDFGAFGEVVQVVQDGDEWARRNPFLFATKVYDWETGLYQYNHRYYSPKLGRFISRDPIAENGGLNLYAYCGNDPIGCVDYLGQGIFSFFKKIDRAMHKLWNKFRHTIISTALAIIYPPLAIAYNVAVGARYGGIRGAFTALAGSGVLGLPLQLAARYDGLYRQFRRGKFLNNLGDYFASAAISQSIDMGYHGQAARIPAALARIPGDFVGGFRADASAAWRTMGRVGDVVFSSPRSQSAYVVLGPLQFPDWDKEGSTWTDAEASRNEPEAYGHVYTQAETDAWLASQAARFGTQSPWEALASEFRSKQRAFNAATTLSYVVPAIPFAAAGVTLAAPTVVAAGRLIGAELADIYMMEGQQLFIEVSKVISIPAATAMVQTIHGPPPYMHAPGRFALGVIAYQKTTETIDRLRDPNN
jgi:RHS repeat-associated protein